MLVIYNDKRYLFESMIDEIFFVPKISDTLLILIYFKAIEWHQHPLRAIYSIIFHVTLQHIFSFLQFQRILLQKSLFHMKDFLQKLLWRN